MRRAAFLVLLAACDDPAPPAAPNPHSDRERAVREKIDGIGAEAFPDDTGITWHVRSFEHHEATSLVEVEPEPSTVGYPKFRFELGFENPQEPKLRRCFCWRDEKWELLFD